MPAPTFPLGLAVADDPQTSMLQVRLFENDPPADGFTDLAQVVEVSHPDYQGSRPEDWFDPDEIDVNMVFRKSKKIDFRMASDSPGKVAKGWYCTILLDGVPKLVAWEKFGQPIDLSTTGSNAVVQVELNVYDVAFVAP